jgi:DNA polymerase
MLVGEGPGEREDELGRPFVGRAGELLDRILEAAGFSRPSVYITNVVMCRPPGNRIPTDKEISACHPYLRRKIVLIRPLVVLCLGSTSARALIDREARITQIRGRWFHREGIYYLATYHPAAVLRDVTKKRPVWEDFLKVRELLRRF